jgi:hypothetical protein
MIKNMAVKIPVNPEYDPKEQVVHKKEPEEWQESRGFNYKHRK